MFTVTKNLISNNIFFTDSNVDSMGFFIFKISV